MQPSVDPEYGVTASDFTEQTITKKLLFSQEVPGPLPFILTRAGCQHLTCGYCYSRPGGIVQRLAEVTYYPTE